MNVGTPLLTSVLVPVGLLIIKALLSDEISYWITFLGCYLNRPFDVDNNPKTHDWAMIYNPGNGEWECCSLTFNFGVRKRGNGTFVHHYDNEWNLRFTERVSFNKWRHVGKAKLKSVKWLHGLEEKINEMK